MREVTRDRLQKRQKSNGRTKSKSNGKIEESRRKAA
jgi:hypothetical protein